jgi:hypothetical protein
MALDMPWSESIHNHWTRVKYGEDIGIGFVFPAVVADPNVLNELDSPLIVDANADGALNLVDVHVTAKHFQY